MCNPAFHPLWSLIGKSARLKPATVWGIVSALLADDPILELLDDKGKVAVLAEWSGLKTVQVALVLAGLQARGVLVDGEIAPGWRDIVTVPRDVTLSRSGHAPSVTSVSEPDVNTGVLSETKAERIRRLARERKRRQRERDSVTSVTPAGPFIEEERDISGSSPQERAHAQAGEPERVTKRRALLSRVTAAAPQMLEAWQATWFAEQMTEERVERFLAHGSGALFPQLRGMMELLITRTEWRGAPMGVSAKPPDPKQPSLRLPFEGGLRPIDPKAVLGGITDPGLQEALSGLGRAIGS